MLFKKIFLLFNIVGLLMYSFFSNEGISITQTLPSSVKPGEEFTVELNINRGTIAGFAKLQQELPEGCTAKVKESATGNFTFADRQVKIIWMSVPTDASFKVSYTVTVPQGISVSSFDLAGKISYIENNEKKVFEITPKSVSVSGVAASTASTTTTPTETKTTPTETAAVTTPTETATTATPTETASTTTTPTETANTQKIAATGASICERTVTPVTAGKEYTVSLSIKKGTISGFAKLEELIPEGLTASGIENATGVFSFVDGKAKYLWMSLPAEAEFKVSYKLTVEGYTNPTFDLNGTFSYLENEETKKAPTPTSTVSLSGAAVANNTATNTNTAANTTTNTNTASNNTNTASDNSAASNNTNTASNNTASNNTTSNNNTSTASTSKASSKSAAGIVYRVQVTATHKSVPNTYFNDNYKIVGEIFSEQHEGWFKFTTGAFNEYSGARDKRVELSSNSSIPGPFVTAYNSGRRITVQEALMVSNQKWVQ